MRYGETGEYRYFIPYANSYLLHSPHTITDRASLRTLQRKLEDLNPVEYIMNHRPDSRWEPVFITNLRLAIFSMDYPLGKAVDLPKPVKGQSWGFTSRSTASQSLSLSAKACRHY